MIHKLIVFTVIHFSEWQHICLVCYMLSLVCLSITRVDQSKMVEVRIVQVSILIPVVFAGKVSSRNSNRFHLSGGIKPDCGRAYISKIVGNTSKVTFCFIMFIICLLYCYIFSFIHQNGSRNKQNINLTNLTKLLCT